MNSTMMKDDKMTTKQNEHFFVGNDVELENDMSECEDEEDEEDEEDDEYSRKRTLSEILSKHNIDDVLKEKILDDYVISTINMMAIQKAIKKRNLEKKIIHCEDGDEEDGDEEDEDEFVDEDFDGFVDEDFDEDEYIRQRHERIGRKHNLSEILSKYNIDDDVLKEKIMVDYFYSMV
jgi:hypothetical protein